MTANTPNPLDGVEPESVTAGSVDAADVRSALSASNPLVRQRGVDVCDSLAGANVDAVRPFLDDVASSADDDNAAIALRAISVLDAVAEREPGALEGRAAGLAFAAGSEIADVQLTAGVALGKLVVERPNIVAPHVGELVAGIRATEPDRDTEDFSAVDDPVTRRTLQEHEKSERQRRTSGRRTLINVVVAVCEEDPEAAFDAVGDLVAITDDVDPSVVGGAVDALGELAAADSDAIEPATEALFGCLHHPRTFVRARAIRALGYRGDDDAVSKLRTLAEEEEDDDVWEIAAETAEFLAERS